MLAIFDQVFNRLEDEFGRELVGEYPPLAGLFTAGAE